MFDTIHTTSYGLKFHLITPDEWAYLKIFSYKCGWSDFDRHNVDLHILNCGYGILDVVYQRPITNEYDLDEIYEYVKSIN